MQDRPVPLRSATTGFVLLVVAVVAAGLIATALKRTPSYVQAFRIDKRQVDPTVRGSRGTVFVGFSTKRRDEARVSIQSRSGRTVKVLGPPKPTLPYRRVSFAWRAVSADGRPLNPGAYYVRLELLASHRDLVFDDRSVTVTRHR